MTIQELGSIGEFVAAVATVITLGYIALQIRQNTHAARINAELDIAKQQADWFSRMIAQPDLLRLWDSAAEDSASLSPDDKRRFLWVIAELFIMYEGHYHTYQKGYVSEDAWHTRMAVLRALLTNPVVKEWWDLRMGSLSAGFYDYLDSLRSEPLGTWSHQNIGGAAKRE